MPDRHPYAATICGLIDYFGGYETVARILNVTVAELEGWAAGRAKPPTEAFLRLINKRQDFGF
jgi:hypothetical protein